MSLRYSRLLLRDQRGSIAPLGIGLFIFSIAFSFTLISASSMFIFQKRLTTFAESTAIFVASGQGDSVNFLEQVGVPKFEQLRVSDNLAADSVTVVVSVCALWRPPIVTVDEFTKREVCSHASARSGN